MMELMATKLFNCGRVTGAQVAASLMHEVTTHLDQIGRGTMPTIIALNSKKMLKDKAWAMSTNQL